MKKIITKEPERSVFRNRQKEAEYWEKHFDETWTKGKSVKIKFAKNLSRTLNIRLDPDTLSNIRNQAKRIGMGPSQLIRMWVMEKMNGKGIHSSIA